MQAISLQWTYAALRRKLTGRGLDTDPRLIYRDRDFAIGWQPGTSKKLVLVFTGIRAKGFHPEKLDFHAIATDQGRNHALFITDRHSSWYSRKGMRDRIIAQVRKFADAHGIESMQAIGNSMGGHGAILFSRDLPISDVIAFVPQIFMHEWLLGMDEWNKFKPHIHDGVERDLNPIIAASDASFSIVFGDQYKNDQIHFRQLRKILPLVENVKVVVVPGQAHEVAAWLKGQGQLAGLVKAMMTGNRAALEDCSRLLARPLDLTLA
jgi:pimeloyl-ACP methyl ester carboxylesterase